jgi:Zn-dependent protease
MIFRTGWLRVGTYHGAYVLTGASWAPGAWLGFALLVLVHELGHAVMVRAHRFRVVGIDVHGMGGECQWAGPASERQAAAIAWGGVLAQLVVLFTTPIWGDRLPQPAPPFATDLITAFTTTNVILIALNLLPVAPLDGATAWKILRVRDLLPSRKEVDLRRRARAIQRELDALSKETDDDEPPEAEESGGRKPDRRDMN